MEEIYYFILAVVGLIGIIAGTVFTIIKRMELEYDRREKKEEKGCRCVHEGELAKIGQQSEQNRVDIGDLKHLYGEIGKISGKVERILGQLGERNERR